MLRKWIEILECLNSWNNFHTSHAIVAGLNMTHIYRLKATWVRLH